MKSSKAIYSALKTNNKADDSQIDKIKMLSLQLLKDIAQVCNDCGYCYMLAFGTLLGAVRHKGYIPWDDDVDIIMHRSEIESFLKVFQEKYSQKYRVVEVRRRPIYFYTIEIIGTEAVELASDNPNLITGVKVDIFVLENSHHNHIVDKTQRILRKILVMSSSLAQDFRYPSSTLLAEKNTEVVRYYRTRRFLGMFCSIVSKKCYEKLYLSLCNNSESDYKFVGIGKEVYPTSIVHDYEKYEFENEVFWGPKDFDTFLSISYGKNYMQLPPVEKRETHSFLRLTI